MKITYTTIEATAEDLRANRTLAESFLDIFSRIADTIARPVHVNLEAAEEEAEEEDD